MIGVLTLGAQANGGVFYVDASINGGNLDGTTWGDAFATLQDALAVASSGDVVRVAKGIYFPDEGGGEVDGDHTASFVIPDGVILQGGFLNGQTSSADRDLEANKSVLSGDIGQDDEDSDGDGIIQRTAEVVGINTRQIVKPAGEFVLDGFVVNGGEGGGSLSGGGLWADSLNFTVKKCVFLANSGANGGAVSASGAAKGDFEDCLFENNVGIFRGGGVFAISVQVRFLSCDFVGNSGAMGGGAMVISGNRVAGCRFIGNGAIEGAAIRALGTPRIQNCVFHHNTASQNGTVFLVGGFGTEIGNCTFVGNRAINLGGAIYLEGEGSTKISHCLIWGNESEGSVDGVDFHVAGTSIPLYRHSLIEGWNPAGIGNLDGTQGYNAPLFVKAAEVGETDWGEADLRLLPNSPGINQGEEAELLRDVMDLDGDGNTTDFLPIDFDGNPRIIFSKPDIGAYEATSSVIHVRADAGSLGNGGTWQTAIDSLAKALETAEEGQDIWVSSGVYTPTKGNPNAANLHDRSVSFVLKNGVGVFGGFSGVELEMDERRPGLNRSILSGDVDNNDAAEVLMSHLHVNGANSFHVVDGSDTDASAILDGFVVTGGQAGEVMAGTLNNQGGGILVDDGSCQIRNCVVTGNSSLHGAGGGMHFRGGARSSVINCLIQGNAALHGAGGIVSSSSDVVFVGCTIANNQTFATPATSGALYVAGATIEMENCIVWGNDAMGVSGALESIFYLSASGKIRNSLIEHSNGSGLSWDPAIGADEGGNLDQDPLFAGPLDFRLTYQSPALEKGNRAADLDGNGSETIEFSALISHDLTGGLRFADGDGDLSKRLDLGAYEYQGTKATDIDDDGLSDQFEIENSEPSSATQLQATADPDGDSRNNLEEFVFATDPFSADDPFRPEANPGRDGVRFKVIFSYEESSALFVDLVAEWSADLKQWQDIEGDPEPVSPGEGNLFRIFPDDDEAGLERGFVRFRTIKK